jgi:hypothetical protein
LKSRQLPISTFGIGREFSAAGLRDLLDQLQFEDLLREGPNDGSRRFVVFITSSHGGSPGPRDQ